MGECFPSTPWQPPLNLINMAQTSIHFQPVKGGSEEHNQRTKKLDYVHHELSSQNDYWQSCSQESRLAFVADNAKAKTGRKMQAKATPIREAVVVIKDTTTMSDLKDLSKRLHDRFGIEVFQIAIHKDEGYKKSKDGIKLNLHAHLVADWTDHETGKSLKLNRQDMAEMQTICAEVLNMERGKSSEKQHLSALQFKIKAEEERAEEIRSNASKVQSYGFQLMADNKALESQNSGLKEERDNLQSEAESLVNVVQSARSDLHGLEARRNALDAEILLKAQEKKQAEKEAEEARAKAKQAEAAAISGLVVGGTKKLGNLLGIGKEAKQLKELPQQLTAAKEDGRIEGRKEAIAEVLEEAKLNFGVKEVTPSMVGRAWRARFNEAEQLKNTINEKDKDNARKLTSLNKSNSILKELVYSIWDGAREAVNVLCRYLAYPHLSVSFGRDEVKTIDNALKNAQGTEERKAYGRDLVNLAHAEYPGYADDAHQLSQLRWKMDEVAENGNRWQQNLGQSRGWHL